jgi:hypothetical protein
MFGIYVRNYESLTAYLNKKIEERDKLLAEFDTARAEDNLSRFMHWNGTEFHGAVVHAFQAQRLLAYLDADTSLSEELRFERVKDYVARTIGNMGLRIASRSTSLSANLEEDYHNAFFLELNSKIRED